MVNEFYNITDSEFYIFNSNLDKEEETLAYLKSYKSGIGKVEARNAGLRESQDSIFLGLFNTQENEKREENAEEIKFIQNLASQNESFQKQNDTCLLPEDTFRQDSNSQISLKNLKGKGKRVLSSSDEETHVDNLKVNQKTKKSSSNEEIDEDEKFPSYPTHKFCHNKRKMFSRDKTYSSNLACDNPQSSSMLKLSNSSDSDSDF